MKTIFVLLLSLLLLATHSQCQRAVKPPPPAPSPKPRGPGWDCYVERRFLCNRCLWGHWKRTCQGILLFDRKVMKTVRKFPDVFPSQYGTDFNKLAGRFVPRWKNMRCAGFLSLLLSSRACKVQYFGKAALEAEGMAKAASQGFEPRREFLPVKNEDGSWSLVLQEPFVTSIAPGAGSAASVLTQQQVNNQWQNLFNRWGGWCWNPRYVTRLVNGRWVTQVKC